MANESKENKKSKFPVVGIGASAGGLKAFEAFFKHLPENPGMAFVLIQHLDPNHRSELSELLQNHTRLPVRQVEETTEVEPDHVYVIPPNKRLSIENKLLKLSERDKQRGSQAVIDLFFRALASDLGEQAVCIVLSGTGTDGTQGLKAIKEAGGITFAQSENDAEYSGMPRSAEKTGLVDFVLPAAEIGTRLVEVKDHAANLSLPEDETKLPQDDNEVLQRIMTQLHSRTGHDFSNYKKTTVLRRIRRRMQVQKYSQLADYLSYLRTDEGEATELFKELLISVTNFFRDPEAFRALETSVIPELFHQEEIRVWVAGCATGEEAYSVAILLAEYSSLKNQRHHIQVFASDLDDSALSFARKGVYPDTISADVSQERLDRFFQHEGDSYVVKDELREMVLFANHNLIKDPPFSKLGLITCRNLLIYLNSEVQEQVYKLFHYALGSKGWLFLGSSESLGKAAKLFKEEDKKAKLFLRQDVSEPGIHFPVTPVLKDAVVNTEETEPDQNGIATQARQAILRGYAPAFAVVNKNSDIVYLSQGTGKYLEHPEGEVSHNIVQQAKDGLGLELRTALYRLFKNNISTLNKTILVRKNGESVHLALSVKRLDQSEHALVVFDENVETRFIARTPELIAQEDQHLAAQLDEELRHTRESLQTTIEELETSNEELRASNEELQSMNEELQSTSEELETSKEELQSTNEELATVNQELRNKIEELAAVNSDLENLISSTDVGTVFLDADLRVKRFTPKATDVFNLISTDIGRPFSHISNLVEVSHLARDTARVLETLQPINHKVNS
ncbi:MAG: PAS domain-containing protein, partial [Trueperaceae bacterium]|nr:PAS domain-containing protein [Trueperaceae bacterium]